MMRSLAAALLSLTCAASVTAAEPPKPDEHEKSADAGDKLICKRFTRTGSLVSSYRTCKTKRDWERERDTARSVSSGINSCANMGSTGSC